MSTDLERFRDHARRMATFERDLAPNLGGNCWRGVHAICLIGPDTCPCDCHEPQRTPVPAPSERALWVQLADEIDAYLAAGQTAAVDLFGDTTHEPQTPEVPC